MGNCARQKRARTTLSSTSKRAEAMVSFYSFFAFARRVIKSYFENDVRVHIEFLPRPKMSHDDVHFPKETSLYLRVI